MLTKFGETGFVNLGKLLPGAGAIINGGLDFAETKVIADRSYKMFFEGDFSAGEKESEGIIDVETKGLNDKFKDKVKGHIPQKFMK